MSHLDDYNRRMSLGDAAGPPRSLGDVAAQMQRDARDRAAPPAAGGGSLDVSSRSAAMLVGIGVLLAVAGGLAVGTMKGGWAIGGGIALVVGAALVLFFGLGLLLVVAQRIGPWRLVLAGLVGGFAWWLVGPWLGSLGVPVPGGVVAAVAVVAVLVVRRRRAA
ncbi:hypothetical protein DCC79_13205 [bacterium]|nr:MAG: hypothetical protein DCC79_13205 [bacterium]